MAKKVFVNRAKMSTATTGTSTITLGSAVAGYQTFEEAGVVNGDEVRYVIEDGDNWEIGTGTYTSSGTSLSRTVLESNNADSAISLSGTAYVFITSAADDFVQLDGDTMTGDLGLTDNSKLSIGTDNDLEIVHNGTNTIINERGTGSLKFQVGGTDVATVTSSGFTTNVTGNVTGNLTGDVKATNGTSVLDSGTDGTDATFTGSVTGNVTGNLTGDVTGNADTASALETGRTISLTGDVSGSTTFDGSANVSITATVADDSHDHTNATTSADGFMSASDKTKLDGVEANATADQTASEILTAIKTVDGSGSGLDADLLDGNQASAFATSSHNHTLDSLSNVTITSNSSGEILKWNGTAWVNNTLEEVGALTANQTITLSGDVSGSGTTSISVTVADDSHNHVISNVDGLQTSLNSKLSLSGGTMTGTLTLNADPTSNLHAATKEYVDTIAAAGIHYHDPVRVEAPSNLNATYNNGSSGVGATLTNAGTNAAISIDGVSLSLNDRVLVYNQTNSAHNGIYYVSTVGDGSTAWVLTRATDADSYGASDKDALGEGDAFFVKEGSTGAGELYVMNQTGAITFGTTAITFTVVAETAVYTAGTGITLTGTQFSIGQDVATTASPSFAGATFTGDVTFSGSVYDVVWDNSTNSLEFPDNAQIRLGSSSDFTLYHSTNNFIDIYTGNLYIRQFGNDLDVLIQSDNGSGGTTNYFIADGSTGEVQLYHYGSQKLATKTGGVEVTGTVTATAFSGDGSSLTGISTDLVGDTTPQLGGTLDTNGNLIQFGDSGSATDDRLQFGASQDLEIYHDGSHTRLVKSGDGKLIVSSGANNNIDINAGTGGNTIELIASTGQVKLYYGGSKKFETTSTGALVTGQLDVGDISIDESTISDATGALTIDVATEIILDADDFGKVQFYDGGTHYGTFRRNGSDVEIKTIISDADIKFIGVDGGGAVTALTLDMSDAGTAIFNHDISLPDNGKVKIGSSDDLQLYHNTATSFIDNYVGNLDIRNFSDDANVRIQSDNGSGGTATYLTANGSTGEVQLYHYGSEKLATKSTGIDVTGNITVSGTVDGRDVATDGTKLDTIATNADVTPSWVPASDPSYLTAHPSITAASSVDNTGAAVIQDVTLDTNGHVTGLASKTLSYTDVGAAASSHTHTSSQITDFQEAVEDRIGAAITAGSNITVSYNDTTGETTIAATDTNTTYSAGSGIDLTGTTFSHSDTSSQASVSNAGRTYIQSITLDTYGHITSISSGTETVVNTDTNTTSLAIENGSGASQFTVTDTVGLEFAASGATSVAFDSTNKRVTFSSTDTNTTYGAGSGLTLSSTTFSVNADQRSVITQIGQDTNDYISVGTTNIDFVLDGNVDARIENDGDFHADGNVIAYSTTISDPRLKENIKPVTNGLEKVMQLNGYTFDYKADGVSSAGVMSPEVAKVLPSAIKKSKLKLKMGDDNETEYDIVQYDQLTALLIEAIKDLKAEIEELKNGSHK
jgi:hypothetical protein